MAAIRPALRKPCRKSLCADRSPSLAGIRAARRVDRHPGNADRREFADRTITGTTLHVDGGANSAAGFLDWPYSDGFSPAPLAGTLEKLFQR